MAQTSLTSSADTMLLDTGATTNYSTETQMYVGEYNGGAQIGRSLVKFDLSSLSGKTISSATLRLTDLGSDFASNTRTMHVYRLLRNWVEAEATWNVYSSGNNWGTAGAGNSTTDYNSTSLGSLSIDATESAGEQYDITLDAATIQSMVDGGVDNYGFLLKMETESDDMHQLGTKEHGTAGYRPTLIVETADGTATFLLNFI